MVSFCGTGSCPQSPHGWQRQIRFTASQPPAMAPCSRTASIAYCEHVGVKRQPPMGPKRKTCAGEIVQRYARMTRIKIVAAVGRPADSV